ncbi:hypothetical protein [Phascolarctobacterium sp.]|uniref:hypothetical protein n=1 Tax=Phascolarctobacterium sp. TaxID=2049039 RepID=UPI003865EA79
MNFLAKADSWDYLALALVIGGAWLLLGGINKLAAANPERVDARKLQVRAMGAVAAGIVYLVVHFMA